MTPTQKSERTPVIELRDAGFGYDGRSRVGHLSGEVWAGSAVALIGPNGSGKSTLLRGLLGLAELTAGEVRVLGTDPVRARARIGSLPQADQRDTSLPITLRQVVTMGLYRGLSPLRPIGRSGRARVAEAIDRVGLGHFTERRFGELSGGQQQRGILARALVADPELLLFDEPFNGLDRENRDVLLQLVRDLTAEGRTIIVSTHDLEIAQSVCTHALLLSSGHTPEQPGHPAAYGPLDEALTLEAVQHAFSGTTVEIDQHTVAIPREETE